MTFQGFKDWALIALIGYAAMNVNSLKDEIRELNKTLVSVVATQTGERERTNALEQRVGRLEGR